MKKIITKRQKGKTTELIKLADGYNGIILVKDLNTVKYVENLAEHMGCKVKVLPHYALNNIDRRYLQTKGIYIDDVDLFLSELLNGVKINGISINDD